MMALGGIMREEEHFQIFASRIPTDEGEVDIQALLISLVTDELGKFAVGEPIGALDKNQEPEAKQLDEGYQFVKEKISRLAQSGAASWLYDRSQFRRASSIIRHYTERFVTEALETRRGAIREGRDALPQRRTFVQRAVDEGYSFADVRDQTTTMRIMPSVPFNAKVANSDIWLPKGGGRDGHSSILIEKGQIVVFWHGHSIGIEKPLVKMPTSFAQRARSKERIALSIASFVMIRLLQHFEQIESRDDQPWTEKLGLSLASANDFSVKQEKTAGLDPSHTVVDRDEKPEAEHCGIGLMFNFVALASCIFISPAVVCCSMVSFLGAGADRKSRRRTMKQTGSGEDMT
ncbi:n-alkane-inducible cytochrome p450 [Seiridium cupressi]